MKKLIQVAMVAAALAVAPAAMAAPITGDISFAGNAVPMPAGSWATATGVDFVACGTCTGANSGFEATVQDGSGSYAGTTGTFVEFNDFTFNPFSGVTPLWEFTIGTTTYSFNLESLTDITQTQLTASESRLTLFGFGTLFIDGLEATQGTFNFTANQSSTSFSFSASDAAMDVVPEPGSMLLLGTGLLGLAAVARRRMRKA